MNNSPVDIFRDFRFLCYELTLRAQDPIELPEFIGSTLRGGFGHALKQVGCFVPGDICPPCQQPEQCPYNLLFENRNLARERLPKRFAESPPKLFVLEPPIFYPPRLRSGDRLKFRLILLNHAIDLRIYPIVAMRFWGENGLGYTRGRFELERIVAVNPLTADEQQIYSDADQIVYQDDKPLTIGEICDWCETWQVGPLLKLSFVTPARLPGRGYSPENLELRIVLKSALERLSILALLSGWPKAEIDFDTPLFRIGQTGSTGSDKQAGSGWKMALRLFLAYGHGLRDGREVGIENLKIQFAAPGIHHRCHRETFGIVGDIAGDGFQCRDGGDRNLEDRAQGPCKRQADTQTGKGSRAAGGGHEGQFLVRVPLIHHHCIDHVSQPFGLPPLHVLAPIGEHLSRSPVAQGHRAGLQAGIDTKNEHVANVLSTPV